MVPTPEASEETGFGRAVEADQDLDQRLMGDIGVITGVLPDGRRSAPVAEPEIENREVTRLPSGNGTSAWVGLLPLISSIAAALAAQRTTGSRRQTVSHRLVLPPATFPEVDDHRRHVTQGFRLPSAQVGNDPAHDHPGRRR